MTPKKISLTMDAVDEIFKRLAPRIYLATPLGLGKPNQLLNEIYLRAKNESNVQLKIYTALSLQRPEVSGELGKRFFAPFALTQWGHNYPELQYEKEAIKNHLPENIKVHEFYFAAGAALNSETLQKNYQSINYTHVAEALDSADVNLVVQMIACDRSSGNARYSLSCNPDITLDLFENYQEKKKSLMIVGVIHPDLPFMGGDAEVSEEFFDLIVDDQMNVPQLFSLPRFAISDADHAIGFYTSQLVADDGTIQIGIGSLSDAVVSALLMRHQKNEIYQKLFQNLWKQRHSPTQIFHQPFQKGLYGLSEMVTDGYMHMRRAGILKREVFDDRTGVKTYLHGAFFLGSKDFYAWLRNLKGQDASGIRMTRVSKVNDLYDPHEVTLRRQRKNPRFINTCMQVSLLGGVASETLDDGRVVSGVGGQYNFVAMAHELKDSRSILMLRSTRQSHGKKVSNIVWSIRNLTIPRHLRDIVVTEYGIADLRFKTDEESIMAMIEIADAEFQDELAAIAKKHKKLSQNYQIPQYARFNTAQNLSQWINDGKSYGCFQAFPLGSDFTQEEEKLAMALEQLKLDQSLPFSMSKVLKFLNHFKNGWSADAKQFESELIRMGLHHPQGFKQRIFHLLLLSALSASTASFNER